MGLGISRFRDFRHDIFIVHYDLHIKMKYDSHKSFKLLKSEVSRYLAMTYIDFYIVVTNEFVKSSFLLSLLLHFALLRSKLYVILMFRFYIQNKDVGYSYRLQKYESEFYINKF